MMKSLVIVGAGAAGLACAASAAKAGAKVTLCEAGARVGQKILKTGNGRCNFTNLHVSPEGYNHPEFVREVLEAYSCAKIRAFFGELGLESYADDAGRVYPLSDTAASVLDVLRLALKKYGVTVLDSFETVGLDKSTVVSKDGRRVHGDSIVIATGGGTKLLTQAGHKIIPFSPVLGPLATDTTPIRGLSGIRVKCEVKLLRGEHTVDTERGELLFRDYGVSGIAVFDISRFAKKSDVLSIDLAPDMDKNMLSEYLRARESELSWRGKEDMLTGLFHKRVNEALLRACGTEPARLAEAIKDFRLTVTGSAEPKQAQLTRGGADVRQFDSRTMQSKLVPSVYAAGETLDIDGRCGGYNLHWAFASGLRAAESAL